MISRHEVQRTELLERIAELELGLEDIGWIKFSLESSNEFSRQFLRDLTRISRLYYLKNPLVNRGVSVQAFYVWGQGVTITARDPRIQTIVKAFMEDHANQAELTSHQARTMKEVALQVEGNIFFTFFKGVDNVLKVRTIPTDQVTDIICDPEDSKSVWFYKRQWTEARFNISTGTYDHEARVAYYPDWRFKPDSMPQTIAKDPVVSDVPVYHVKVGGMPDMRFGVPETYSALDWARAYKDFLEDVATLMRAYSRFVGQLTTKGGATGVAAANDLLGTTVSAEDPLDNNRPNVGSIFVSGDAGESTYKPLNVRGASINPEDGRRLLLMAAAALGLPETFFGDVSVGTLATARSLDRPTELKFRDRQTLWGDALHDILQYQVDVVMQDQGNPLSLVGDDRLSPLPSVPSGVDRTIVIDFPPILEHGVDELIGSIVKAATLGGQGQFAGTISPQLTTRMLLAALGEPDIDEKLKILFPDDDKITADSGVEVSNGSAGPGDVAGGGSSSGGIPSVDGRSAA